jgi:hypothetical protein
VDLDDDGFTDILSGSYSRNEQPMAGLFQVLRGKEDKTFQPAETLKGSDGEPLLIPLEQNDEKPNQNHNPKIIDVICTRPTAVDWDRDGDLDIITGNFGGTFYLFMGEGKGKFQPKGELVTCVDGPLKISGHHSDPFMVDWDDDGDLDLLSGSSQGGVEWAENSADKGQPPKLEPFRSLIKPGSSVQYGQKLNESDLKGPTTSTRIFVDDVDGDGKLDILVGDSVTLVSPAEGLTDEEFKTKSDEWQKEWEAALAEMNAQPSAEETDEEKTAREEKRNAAQTKINELYGKRSAFIKEDRTGFVWLYRQK